MSLKLLQALVVVGTLTLVLFMFAFESHWIASEDEILVNATTPQMHYKDTARIQYAKDLGELVGASGIAKNHATYDAEPLLHL